MIAQQLSKLLNTIPTVSPSQLSTFLDCPQKWDYNYTQGLKKSSQNTFHMDRGSYFHRLSHYYYNLLKAGFRPGSPTVIAAMDAKIKEDIKEVNEGNIKLLSTSIPVFRRFITEQSPAIDAQMQVVAVEKEYWVLVIINEQPVFLHGIIDLVYRNIYGKLVIRDHKTSERSDAFSEYKILLFDQLLQYNLAMWMEFEEEIDSVEVNFINLAANPKIRFNVYSTSHGIQSLINYRENLFKIIAKMLDKDIYRRYSADCSSCTFSKLCQLELKGMSTVATISTQYERTNRGLQGQPVGNPTSNRSKDIIIEW